MIISGFENLYLCINYIPLLLGNACIFSVCPRLSLKESVWSRAYCILLISIICPLPPAGYRERTAAFRPLWEIIAFQVQNYKYSLSRFQLLRLLLRTGLKWSIIFCKSEEGRTGY